MQIIKILNNNAVISRNEFNKEIIVIGKGIGYSKKIGNLVNLDDIQKIYIFDDENRRVKFLDLLNNVSLKYLETIDKIIILAQNKLPYKLSENIYLSLLDHLVITVQRFKKKLKMKNVLLTEIQQFYPQEWYVSLSMLETINKDFKIKLPDDEAGFLVMHLINNSVEIPSNSFSYEIMKIIREIISQIEIYFSINFNIQDFNYRRLITHLKFLVSDLLNKNKDKQIIDSIFFNLITKQYVDSFNCSLKIKEFLEKKYNYTICDETLLYLTIHIEKNIC